MDERGIREKAYTENLAYTEVTVEKSKEAFYETNDLMKRGTPIIYQGCIQIEKTV